MTQELRPTFMDPEAAIHAAIVQPDMAETMACGIISNVSSIFSYPLEMILVPDYGSRYFKLPIAILGTLAFPSACFVSATVGVFGSGSRSAMIALVAFWAGWIYHAIRIGRLMKHEERELDSELDNAGLPFFTSKRWLIRRGVHEPAAVLGVVLALYVVGILNLTLALYLVSCAFALSFKAGAFGYASWLFRRTRRDMESRLHKIAQMTSGTTPPEAMPQVMRHKMTAA